MDSLADLADVARTFVVEARGYARTVETLNWHERWQAEVVRHAQARDFPNPVLAVAAVKHRVTEKELTAGVEAMIANRRERYADQLRAALAAMSIEAPR